MDDHEVGEAVEQLLTSHHAAGPLVVGRCVMRILLECRCALALAPASVAEAPPMTTGGWKAGLDRGGGAKEGGTPFGAAGLLADT